MDDAAHKVKVLVVDDQRAIADTFALILNQNGFEAIVAHSGQEAIAAAQAFAPDFLVSDVVMEGINGIDAAVAIAGVFPKCQIVLMSGNPRTGGLLEAAHAQGHMFEVLAKPIHPGELMDRLRSVPREC